MELRERFTVKELVDIAEVMDSIAKTTRWRPPNFSKQPVPFRRTKKDLMQFRAAVVARLCTNVTAFVHHPTRETFRSVQILVSALLDNYHIQRSEILKRQLARRRTHGGFANRTYLVWGETKRWRVGK